MRTALVLQKKPPQRAGATTDWEQIVPMWLHSRPGSTQYVYAPVITDFRIFVGDKPLAQITLQDLQGYANRFIGKQKPRTVDRKLSTLKSLLGFAHRCGLIPYDVGRALRLPKVPDDLAEKILSPEQIQQIIEGETDRQFQTMIRLMYHTGIRASETAGLRWKDLQTRANGEGQITVIGKGAKSRSIRISAKMYEEVMQLRPKRGLERNILEWPIFTQKHKHKPLHRTYITNVVRWAAERVGIPKRVTAHWLRHGHATHALDRGATLPLIMATLGHGDITTTSRYLHVNPEESSSKYFD